MSDGLAILPRWAQELDKAVTDFLTTGSYVQFRRVAGTLASEQLEVLLRAVVDEHLFRHRPVRKPRRTRKVKQKSAGEQCP